MLPCLNIPCRQRAGRIAPFARAAAARTATGGSGGPAGLQPLQQQLQQHIDREDRRIKDLTEGRLNAWVPVLIRRRGVPPAAAAACLPHLASRRSSGSHPTGMLPVGTAAPRLPVSVLYNAAAIRLPPACFAGILYDFFPAALRAVLPPGSDPAYGLSPDASRSVAAAALAVATLMNAPPGFLEFLLCVPWPDLGPLYLRPEREEDGGEPVVPQASFGLWLNATIAAAVALCCGLPVCVYCCCFGCRGWCWPRR